VVQAERLVIRLLVVRLEPAVRLVILRSLGQVDILANLDPVDNQERAVSLDYLAIRRLVVVLVSAARVDGLDPVVRLVTQRSVELAVLQEHLEPADGLEPLVFQPSVVLADKVVRLDIQLLVENQAQVA